MIVTIWVFFIVILICGLYGIIGPIVTILKNAFMIDAIGHTIVAGIAIGFLASHSLHSIVLFWAAIMVSFLMNQIHDFLQKNSLLNYDSSLGISFSLFFSFGILLISLYGRSIHLDLDMILLGNIEYVVYDAFFIAGFGIPTVFISLLLISAVTVYAIYVRYPLLMMILFDREYAMVRGIKVELLEKIIIMFCIIIIVISFNAFGSLLLLGISAAPFGFAWKRSASYKEFIFRSVFYNVIYGIVSCWIALECNFPIAPTITFFLTTFGLLTIIVDSEYRQFK